MLDLNAKDRHPVLKSNDFKAGQNPATDLGGNETLDLVRAGRGSLQIRSDEEEDERPIPPLRVGGFLVGSTRATQN